MSDTLCINCEHLHSDAKRDKWYHWLCTAYPIEPRTNYVNGESMEPYALCKMVNRGECPAFSPGYNILNPKDDE